MRGRVARTQIKVNAMNVIFSVKMMFLMIGFRKKKLRNRTVENTLIIKMLRYSAIKIRAKVPLLNSMLNPDTSSDSPSERSKGVRLVSARVEVNQILNMEKNIRAYGRVFVLYIFEKSIDIIEMRMERRIKDILTSYEIV